MKITNVGKINYWQDLEENVTYHLYNHSIGAANLFLIEDNYIYFLKKWKKYLEPYLDVFAYCLMPNHFHFLVKVKPINSVLLEAIQHEKTVAATKFLQQEIAYNIFLEDQFKRLFSSYSLAFNKQNKRVGSLFRKRFKRVSVGSPEKILEKLCYIHHNPIHHGFTTHYDEWIYSSYIAYFSKKPTSINKVDFLIFFSKIIGENSSTEPLSLSKTENNLLEKFKREHEVYRQRKIDDFLDNDDF